MVVNGHNPPDLYNKEQDNIKATTILLTTTNHLTKSAFIHNSKYVLKSASKITFAIC